MIDAVVFDMDGVIVDSEPVWQQVRVELVGDHGQAWTTADGDACRGRESREWSARISQRIRGALTPQEVFDEVLMRMIAAYEEVLPVFPGAVEAIETIGQEYAVAVASGSPRALVDLVLGRTGLNRLSATVGYGDEVGRGKPAPDVYLGVLDRMGVAPERAVGVEDSVSGLESVLSAGMHAIAIVSPGYHLPQEIVARAALRLSRLGDLTLPMLESLGA
jgi:HAD superfamily hydrolase (TIGR01509 family)